MIKNHSHSKEDIQGSIKVTEENLKSLKDYYSEAKSNSKKEFYFKGMILEMNYASKLISYMDNFIFLKDFRNYSYFF